MSIQYKTYRLDESAEGADVALKHKLFVSGWNLSGILKEIRENKDGVVTIAYKDKVPVGVAVLNYRKECHCFVRKSERGNKIGTNLVRKTTKKQEEFYCYYGVIGSDRFWKQFNKGVYRG